MAGIVFVNPPLSTEDRYGVKSQGGGRTPPLGLTNLAAMTRKHGFVTSIIDAEALSITHEDTVSAVLDTGCRYVGLTAVTISIGHAADIAARVKAADTEITTIIGGPHLTALPHETMSRFPAFDVGVIGEGDYTIIDLLRALEQGEDLSRISGLIIRRDGATFVTSPRARIENLDKLPFPAWDILPDLATHYWPPVHTVQRFPAALMVASRGCPGQCIFCSRCVFGNVLRAYSAEYAFAMIRDLYDNYGIREIQMRDDNFTAYRKRMLELCEILKRVKLDLVWTCAGRVDMVTPAILRAMKEAGCWQIWYGVESGSQSVLNTIKKNTTIGRFELQVEMTRAAGISPCGFFVIGHPSETVESLEETIEFALNLPLDEAHFSFMTPFPGSELFQRAQEYGAFDADWRKASGWLPVFVPHGLTAELLEEYSKKAFRRFYFRLRIVLAYLKRMRTWWHVKVYCLGLLSLIEFLIKRKSPKVDLRP